MALVNFSEAKETASGGGGGDVVLGTDHAATDADYYDLPSGKIIAWGWQMVTQNEFIGIPTNMADTNYTVVVTATGINSSTATIYNVVVGSKATNGFTAMVRAIQNNGANLSSGVTARVEWMVMGQKA